MMDLSPQLLREVEFREQWRGYSCDEVDEFLERMAVAIEGLQAQLREALRRADYAEQRGGDGDSGDELRRTLVLAQRTADAAVEEARVQAAELIADAQDSAELVLDDANRHAEEVLSLLVEQRQALEVDIQELNAYVMQYRKRLQRELREGMSWLERSGRLEAGPLPELSDLPTFRVQQTERSHPRENFEPGGDDSRSNLVGPSKADEHEVEIVRFDDTAAFDITSAVDGEDTGPHGIVLDAPLEDFVSEGSDLGQDPFLAELRRAVTDSEPLGPRDREAGPAESQISDDLYDEGFSSRFRRRRS